MANFNSPAEQSSQHLALLGELNIEGLNPMPSRTTGPKEMPPMNPLSMTGLYIPPEETRQQHQHSIEDSLGWGMSDDQNDSDDEMDGNEFDLDFEDADFLPPPDVDPSSQSFADSYQQFQPSAFQPAAFQPSSFQTPYHSSFQQQCCSAESSSTSPSANAYNQEYRPPLRFINPSRLQLPQEHQQQGMEFLNTDPVPTDVDPSQIGLYVDDLNLDIEFDELYPIIGREEDEVLDGRHQQITPQPDVKPQVSEVEPVQIESVQLKEPLLSPNPAQAPISHNTVQPAAPTVDLPSPRSPSPLEEKPLVKPAVKHSQVQQVPQLTPPQSRRKTRNKYVTSDDDMEYEDTTPPPTTRRKFRRHTPHTSSSNSHVCDKVYPDGTQCHRSFTRPYDLARHQETLHASVRKTFKCDACGERSKTFSRLDALSRHMRLKHPSD